MALALELWAFFRVSVVGLLGVALVVAGAEAIFPGHEIPYLLGLILLSFLLYRTGGEAREWFESSYFLARQILPLLFLGVSTRLLPGYASFRYLRRLRRNCQ